MIQISVFFFPDSFWPHGPHISGSLQLAIAQRSLVLWNRAPAIQVPSRPTDPSWSLLPFTFQSGPCSYFSVRPLDSVGQVRWSFVWGAEILGPEQECKSQWETLWEWRQVWSLDCEWGKVQDGGPAPGSGQSQSYQAWTVGQAGPWNGAQQHTGVAPWKEDWLPPHWPWVRATVHQRSDLSVTS